MTWTRFLVEEAHQHLPYIKTGWPRKRPRALARATAGMGIGSALRRVLPGGASPGKPSRESKSGRARRSRSSRVRPSVVSEPPRPPPPRVLTQKQAQERAVIASYRARLTRLSAQLAALWNTFDARPDDYAPTIDIRELRNSLQIALESYYAALGAQSPVGIEQVIQVMRLTDKRLALLDAEVAAEVGRFEDTVDEIAARYERVRNPAVAVNLYADADAVLMELELYRDAWSGAMDSTTRRRLEQADTVLKGIMQRAAPAHIPAVHVPYMPSARGGGMPQPVRSHPQDPREHNEYPYRDDQSSSSSFGKFDTALRGGYESSAPQVLREAAAVHHQMGMRSAYREPQSQGYAPEEYQSQGYVPQHNYGHAFASHSAAQFGEAESRANPPRAKLTGVARLEDRVDASSSESGDEETMRMVISRTRTLRDMAESVMGLQDDHTVASGLPSSRGRGGVVSQARTQNGRSRSRTSGVHPSPHEAGPMKRAGDRRSSSSRDGEQPSVGLAKSASFASTLYYTRHRRVDSISDAGILLQRSNVRGDGRCLFRALARGRAVARGNSIPGERAEREEADLLRERAVAELIRYRELLARFFVIEGDFGQYTRKMSHPRTYGGEPELLMLAKLLHVPIAVYLMKNGRYRQIQVYGKQYRGEPLRILYSDGVHYDALLVASK